jgi:hypothetical protein
VLFVTVRLVKHLEVCCYTTMNVFSMHLSGDSGKSGGGGAAGENVVIMTSSGG